MWSVFTGVHTIFDKIAFIKTRAMFDGLTLVIKIAFNSFVTFYVLDSTYFGTWASCVIFIIYIENLLNQCTHWSYKKGRNRIFLKLKTTNILVRSWSLSKFWKMSDFFRLVENNSVFQAATTQVHRRSRMFQAPRWHRCTQETANMTADQWSPGNYLDCAK